jgi:tetratricopeptide (TPR) repeat protein
MPPFRLIQSFAPFLVLIAVIVFDGCNLQNPHMPVLAGNYAYGRGDYQESTVRYLEALEREEYTPWIRYNLANVYHSLGEFDAAFELWDQALDTDDLDLLFAVYFNRGILLYEQGKYEQAFESFKTALVYDPNDVGSKLNLELTLLKLQGARTGASQLRGQSGEAGENELSADSIRMFEYIRRKEEQLWVQENQQAEPPAANDW